MNGHLEDCRGLPEVLQFLLNLLSFKLRSPLFCGGPKIGYYQNHLVLFDQAQSIYS